jgi:hypothetical protein
VPWRHIGQWRYSSTILDLGTRWRWVVNFTPRPLYLRENRPRYSLDRRIGGPQSRSGQWESQSYLYSSLCLISFSKLSEMIWQLAENFSTFLYAYTHSLPCKSDRIWVRVKVHKPTTPIVLSQNSSLFVTHFVKAANELHVKSMNAITIFYSLIILEWNGTHRYLLLFHPPFAKLNGVMSLIDVKDL